MSYSLYIDESGDEGLKRSGLSAELFFMGAVLVKDELANSIIQEVDKIKKTVSLDFLHFSKISKHNRKVFIFEQFSRLPIKCFSLVSDKNQLGFYKKEAQKKGRYYNKNFKYLLESVGEYCLENEIVISNIIPEYRRQHDYAQLIRFLITVRDDKMGMREKLSYNQDYYHRADFLKVFNFENTFKTKEKDEDPLLQLADGLCHSVKKLFIPDQFGIIEYRYFHEIRRLMHSKNRRIINHGLVPVMNFKTMNLDKKTEMYLNFLHSVNTNEKNYT